MRVTISIYILQLTPQQRLPPSSGAPYAVVHHTFCQRLRR